MGWTRDEMARRAAREVEPGMVVNLGIGIPPLVANYLPEDGSVMIHSENGLLGMGPFPRESEIDAPQMEARVLFDAIMSVETWDVRFADAPDVTCLPTYS